MLEHWLGILIPTFPIWYAFIVGFPGWVRETFFVYVEEESEPVTAEQFIQEYASPAPVNLPLEASSTPDAWIDQKIYNEFTTAKAILNKPDLKLREWLESHAKAKYREIGKSVFL